MNSLNPNQQKAVTYPGGPLLIVAGAGTGKTRVITERIRYLLKEKKALPQEILALTFTEKASREMVNRVDDVMPIGYEEPYISTFHSFAKRILEDKGLEIGLNIDFKILTSTDSWMLFRENLFNFNLKYFRPLGNPAKFISAILKFFSRLQDEVVSPEDFSQWVNSLGLNPLNPENLNRVQPLKGGGPFSEEEGEKMTKERWEELSSAYKKWTEIKIENSYLDFGDLINWTIKLFKQRPNILKKYQEQFKYVFVDEFQDTNWAQYELLKLLCPSKNSPNLVVVGDDNQSIYKFRGAAVSNILNFKKDYPKALEIVLDQNYRSFQEILDASYKLIKNNDPDTLEAKLGISKMLKSEIRDHPSSTESRRGREKSEIKNHLNAVVLENAEGEADFVAETIIKLVGENPSYTYKDFAVLARANNHLEPFISAFRRYQMPYQVVGNRGLFNTEEVKTIISFLRFSVNQKDDISFFHLINSEVFEIESFKIATFLQEAKLKKQSLWSVFNQKQEFEEEIKIISEMVKGALKVLPTKMVYEFVQKTGYDKKLSLNESEENLLKLKNLNYFFDYVKAFERQKNGDTISSFIAWLDLALEAGENPAQAQIEDIDTINLLTVHSAKGLEFPVVFLVSLTSDRFPTRNRSDIIEIPEGLIKETLPEGNYHVQEERRLFYVGVTRAKDSVFLTYAKNYGGVREKIPSGFIKELGIEIKKEDKVRPLSLFAPQSSKVAPKPKKLQDGKVLLDYLSYSQVNCFNTCPLKYKYQYILKIPVAPNHVFAFGDTIHIVLNKFEKLALGGKILAEKDILDLYETSFINQGYESPEHREERYEDGKKYLKNYLKLRKTLFGKPKLGYLEAAFKLKFNDFNFGGRIDRVDDLNGGVEIIDYKTGKIKTQKEVDKDDQLTVYALAARDYFKFKVTKLSLYFVEDGIKVSTTRKDSDLEKVKGEIIETANNIRKENFEPQTGPYCSFCDFRHICPAYKNY